ncbi:hypothetical protein EPO44_18585 [bacterium]|nr:MAG: hypothetical protein EPO44_18585 [bacterium]
MRKPKYYRLLAGEQVRKRAEELGIPTTDPYRGELTADELRNKIRDAERSERERWLWLIALLSAIASIVSAAAAWTAVFMRPLS